MIRSDRGLDVDQSAGAQSGWSLIAVRHHMLSVLFGEIACSVAPTVCELIAH